MKPLHSGRTLQPAMFLAAICCATSSFGQVVIDDFSSATPTGSEWYMPGSRGIYVNDNAAIPPVPASSGAIQDGNLVFSRRSNGNAVVTYQRAFQQTSDLTGGGLGDSLFVAVSELPGPADIYFYIQGRYQVQADFYNVVSYMGAIEYDFRVSSPGIYYVKFSDMTRGNGDTGFDVNMVVSHVQMVELGLLTQSGPPYNGPGTYKIDSWGTISSAAVPEPSQYAMLAGIGLVGFGVWRKRTKNSK